MAYIGNTVENQGFTPAIDYFSGNGVTVTFTLSRPVASVAQMIVAIDNVIQNPNSSFTVAGNAITFSSAPLSGTNNIWVEYTSLITTYQGISQDPTVIGDIRATGGYLAEGDFGNSFVDGAILDYVTGLGRITVGDADGLAIYNGGTAGRTALMTVAATGNVGIGTVSPTSKLDVTGAISLNNVALPSAGTARLYSRNTDSSLYIQSGSGNTTYLLDGSQNTMATFGASTVTFNTGNTERMRIDSSGRITAPFQPAFDAIKNTGGIPGNTTITSYGTVQLNVGSSFNASTGLFTAPVAGNYLFTYSCGFNSATNGYFYGFDFRKNGVSVGLTVWQIAQGANDNSVTSIKIIPLSAGDTVALLSNFQGSVTIVLNFNGFLIG